MLGCIVRGFDYVIPVYEEAAIRDLFGELARASIVEVKLSRVNSYGELRTGKRYNIPFT